MADDCLIDLFFSSLAFMLFVELLFSVGDGACEAIGGFLS